ncbi:unnamed protein product [Aphis gossypii]|uniref:SAM domain-containing protein n=1 Tax=Aphis gossypii TaxID=80765 RepID=A0A9P0NSG8_APHGO|nr:unnamed protein product [Aphis gossypii]
MSIYFPDSLFEISGNAVNKLKEPISWSWSVSNVMDWVQYGLKLPQYVIIFKENNIDGKKLIFINCQTLPSMHITDFDHIKYIAKNVRHLYGLSPDTEYHNGINGQRSVYHAYGRYYLYLAANYAAAGGKLSAARGRAEVQETLSLFDYMQSIGIVTDMRHRGPRTSGCRSDDGPRRKHKTLLARLPATEYLRGGQCAHADLAVARFRPMLQQTRVTEAPRRPASKR